MHWGVSMPRGRFRHVVRALCAMLALALSALLPTAAQAQSVTAQGGAQAVVLTPLTLLKVDDLDFGRIAPRPTAGTVVLNPVTGTCTVTGTIVHSGLCQPAVMAGMTGSRTTFKIEVQGNTTLLGPGTPMILDTMTAAPLTNLNHVGTPNPRLVASGNIGLRVTSTTRMFTFAVGGTLRVNANQAPGIYTGTFSIQANYQ